jgi:hypothetical protein
VKSIKFPILSGIQLSDSLFDRNGFFLAIRCIKELAGQMSSKSKVPSFSSEFQLIEVP